MRVAVIGAGMAGLSAARDIGAAGHSCDVYERWPGLGGQVASLDVGDGHLLERYYHHLFTSDRAIVELYAELGMAEAIQWRKSSVAMFVDGASHPFTSPLDLLRFSPVSIATRLRMGLAVLWLQRRHRSVEPFEEQTAREWIVKAMGHAGLGARSGARCCGASSATAPTRSRWDGCGASSRSAARSREPRRARSCSAIRAAAGSRCWTGSRPRSSHDGGRVLVDRPAASHQRRGRRLRGHRRRRGLVSPRTRSAQLRARAASPSATTPCSRPSRTMSSPPCSTSELGSRASARDIASKLESIEYHTALCVLLELDRSFTPFYWTNIADPSLPFVGLVEHTNLVSPARLRRSPLPLHRQLRASRAIRCCRSASTPCCRPTSPGLKQVNPAYRARLGQSASGSTRAGGAADRHRRLPRAHPRSCRPRCRA